MSEITNILIARETRADTQIESSKTSSAKNDDNDFAKLLEKVDDEKNNEIKQKQSEAENEKFDNNQEASAQALAAMQNPKPPINNMQDQQTQNGQPVKTTTEEDTNKPAISEIDAAKKLIAEFNLETSEQISDKLNKELTTADLASQLAKSAVRGPTSKDSKSVNEAFFTLSSASANAAKVQSELNLGNIDQLSSSLDNKLIQTNTVSIPATQTSGNSNGFADMNSQDSQAAFAAQLSSNSVNNIETEVQAVSKMPDIELHQRIIDQVVHEVRISKLADRTDLVIRLTPPELGTLKIKLMQDASGMTTQIQTCSEQVKNLLQAHVPAIVESLSNAGVKLDKVTIAHDVAFNTFAQNFSQSNAENRPGQSGRYRQSFARQIDGVDLVTSASLLRNEAISTTAYSWLA